VDRSGAEEVDHPHNRQGLGADGGGADGKLTGHGGVGVADDRDGQGASIALGESVREGESSQADDEEEREGGASEVRMKMRHEGLLGRDRIRRG